MNDKLKTRLIDIATVVRSKNSGPFELTLDIIFKSREIYERVKVSNQLNKNVISRIYRIDDPETVKVVSFDPADAIKITFPRAIASGSIGDRDIYGAQQHAPLLTLELKGAFLFD